MLGLEPLRLGNARYVGLGSLCTVAGPAEDLKIVGFVCAAEGYGEDVINVPRLSGLYGHVACLTCAFLLEEEAEAEGRGEALAFHLKCPMAGQCRGLGRWQSIGRAQSCGGVRIDLWLLLLNVVFLTKLMARIGIEDVAKLTCRLRMMV